MLLIKLSRSKKVREVHFSFEKIKFNEYSKLHTKYLNNSVNKFIPSVRK